MAKRSAAVTLPGLMAVGPYLPLAFLAFLLVLPLFLHGPSCGHDFGFHMQSWMDAGDQMRHGNPLPRWTFSPAFNAGEPRFVFYPPLSWLLGSVLLLALPSGVVPAVYTWLALTGAAWAMYREACRLSSAPAALAAAAVYAANPYLLFTALERTAYAELLAAAWMPLLLGAALAPAPRVLALAVPLALLWLTNAPAAVMGTYALVLVAVLRLVHGGWIHRRSFSAWSKAQMPSCLVYAGGLALGLGLPGFYLVPAATERRFVQVAMAIIPNMRVEDNFLFGHTGYGPHDQVLHTASLVAVCVIGLTALALVAADARQRAQRRPELEGILVPLILLALAVSLLLLPVSLPVWHRLPELAFLQFPWRFLAVLGPVLGFAVAFALRGRGPLLLGSWLGALLFTAVVPAITEPVAYRDFRQGCEASELPSARLARFRTLHGVGPTDEYTPGSADNDQLRWDDPAWWLATDPNAPGPGTVPNPAATITDYDEPPPLEQTVSGRAPHHLTVRLKRPEDLILNLRDYPAWEVRVNGATVHARAERDDGLLALALPAGTSTVDLQWKTLPDVYAGTALSFLALAGAAFAGAGASLRRSRRINPGL